MEKVQLLLRQHVGAPCAPCVAVGDKVKKGTLIATPTGLGANIFSSVYGEVSEILEDRIVIKADAEQPDEFVPIDVPEDASKLDMIKAAGIVGMGGAGFPTGIKLNIDLSATEQGEFREDINPELPKDFKLEHSYILINDSECEPGLAHNIKQTIEQTDKVIRGVKYCMEITKADKAIFAIKKKNREAVLALLDALKDEENISVHLLPDIYPMGEERAVVRECLGVNLDTTQLPSAARSVVINLETVAKIAEAIEEKKPCISKNVTVRGNIKGGNEAHVFMDVPVGISVGELIEMAGGLDKEDSVGEIIMGGAFTGRAAELDSLQQDNRCNPYNIQNADLTDKKVGLLVCACGGNEARMRTIAEKMHGEVVSVCRCKQAIENKPGAPLKCLRPGNCPGQVKNNMQFKKDGCEYIIIGNCSDCSNTVMASAPQMGLKVFHQTDHVMRAIGHAQYRQLTVSKQVDQDINVED